MALFITILIICILAGAEVDLFIPSFPELQKVFRLTPFMVQLTLSANFIPYCICCLFTGALGDRFNRRTIMLLSLSIFVIGSLLCVFASNFNMMISGRFLQGMGMAGPSILAYVVIADQYPLEKQPAMLGMLNGITTLAMAFAPVIGSYVNLYFNWRGNFVILLILGVVTLIFGYFVFPSRAGDPKVSLSPKAYLPLFYSKKFMIFALCMSIMGSAYWTFIGMAPIVYMEDMGVSLKHFGYYQGAIAFIFSILSLCSAKIMELFGSRRCLSVSIFFYFIGTLCMLALSITNSQTPLIITGVMMLFAVSVIFPINLFYPISLEVVPNAKSRAAAIIQSFRLVITAIALQVVGYYYTGHFFPLGFGVFVLSSIALMITWHILSKGWGHLENKIVEVPANPQ